MTIIIIIITAVPGGQKDWGNQVPTPQKASGSNRQNQPGDEIFMFLHSKFNQKERNRQADMWRTTGMKIPTTDSPWHLTALSASICLRKRILMPVFKSSDDHRNPYKLKLKCQCFETQLTLDTLLSGLILIWTDWIESESDLNWIWNECQHFNPCWSRKSN